MEAQVPTKRVSWSVTQNEIREMRKLRKKGWSDAEIGRKLGVSRQAVRYHLGPSGRPIGVPPAVTPQEVVALAKRGMNDEKIAKRFGLSVSRVRELRNEGGLKYRRGVKPYAN